MAAQSQCPSFSTLNVSRSSDFLYEDQVKHLTPNRHYWAVMCSCSLCATTHQCIRLRKLTKPLMDFPVLGRMGVLFEWYYRALWMFCYSGVLLNFIHTCMKYSSSRQSAQGSETSMGRTSFEMSQHLMRIFLSCSKEGDSEIKKILINTVLSNFQWNMQ